MADITVLLAAIMAAKKGEEVRGSIHDAIEQCYEDGRAGVNDLQARQLIETVAAVNEEQQAALEVLQARVEELENGEGGSSQQSTTIDIPTVLVDGGVVENVSVNNNSTTTRHITFTTEFTETPKVMVAIGKNVGAVSQYGYLSANILYPTVTTTGFDFFLANRTGSDRSPGVVWYAYQPTVKTIDLDITIPETEGMTEAEVREITGPIAAAVDALKTGYDGTTYQTAAEAVRTQINDLHVLIGDEPGTAIDASAIGYGEDSNVEDALDGLNGRLEELEEGGTGGADVPTEVRQALYRLLNNNAFSSSAGFASDVAVLQSWATEVTDITISQSAISISGAATSQLTAVTVPAGGLVTWSTSNPAVATVSSNGLVTGISNGTTRIMASCGGKNATCDVTVSGFATLTGITATYTQSGSVYPSDTLDSLKANLVVVASYSDSSTRTLSASDYTLAGTLTYGVRTITATYGGFTDTFTVNVTLPSGYTAYDYVYNNTKALNSVIDTGIEGAYCGNEYAHELTFSLTENSNTSGYGVYGLRSQTGIDPTARIIWTKYANSENKFSLDYSGESISEAYVFDLNTKYKSVTANRRWTLNDVVVRENIGSDGYTPPSTGTIRLFGYATGTTGSYLRQTARIYEFKITEISTGTVVAHMIPCKNSNNVAGFYDVIRGQFYSAPTAGNILAGNDA